MNLVWKQRLAAKPRLPSVDVAASHLMLFAAGK